MKRSLGALAAFAALLAGHARAEAPARPPITGISTHRGVYSAASRRPTDFYAGKLGAREGGQTRRIEGRALMFRARASRGGAALPAARAEPPRPHRLDHGRCRGAQGPPPARTAPACLTPARGDGDAARSGAGSRRRDPEGNLGPVPAAGLRTGPRPSPRDQRAHDPRRLPGPRRAAEDRFYRELLGFRPDWRGAMKPGFTDWRLGFPAGPRRPRLARVHDGAATARPRRSTGSTRASSGCWTTSRWASATWRRRSPP